MKIDKYTFQTAGLMIFTLIPIFILSVQVHLIYWPFFYKCYYNDVLWKKIKNVKLLLDLKCELNTKYTIGQMDTILRLTKKNNVYSCMHVLIPYYKRRNFLTIWFDYTKERFTKFETKRKILLFLII